VAKVLKLLSAGRSHTGRVRTSNEDAFELVDGSSLFVLADGMGGYECGEVASRLAVDSVKEFFALSEGVAPERWPCLSQEQSDRHSSRLQSAVTYAHRKIQERIVVEGLPERMGTTVVVLHFAGGSAYVAHVGDSRCYVLGDRGFRLLTSDHTMVSDLSRRYGPDLVRRTDLTPYGHILTRALGGSRTGEVRADISITMMEQGDVYLVCSDGLHSEVPDTMIKRILEEERDVETAASLLVEAAVDRGGKDNVTAVLVRVEELDDEEATMTV